MEVDECRKNKIIGIAKRGSCGKLLYIVHIVFSFLNHFLRDIQIRLPLPLNELMRIVLVNRIDIYLSSDWFMAAVVEVKI